MRWTALALSLLALSCGRPADEAPRPAAAPLAAAWSLAWNPFSIERIPWARRLAFLRPGDSRRQIEALIGPAPVEWPIDAPPNGASRVLVYPNPDAPRELKPEQRQILFYLDAAGFLLVSFDMSMSC